MYEWIVFAKSTVQAFVPKTNPGEDELFSFTFHFRLSFLIYGRDASS